MNEVIIRLARLEDFNELCNRLPPFTCEGLSVVYNGNVVAIATVTMTKAGYVLSAEIKENIDAHKITIWRYAKRTMSMIAQNKKILYAGASNKSLNSRKFLIKLGFKYFCTDEDGMEIFKWQTPSPY